MGDDDDVDPGVEAEIAEMERIVGVLREKTGGGSESGAAGAPTVPVAMSALTATDAPVAPPLGQSAADMSVGMDENQPVNSDTASENYSNTLAELIDSGMPWQDDDFAWCQKAEDDRLAE